MPIIEILKYSVNVANLDDGSVGNTFKKRPLRSVLKMVKSITDILMLVLGRNKTGNKQKGRRKFIWTGSYKKPVKIKKNMSELSPRSSEHVPRCLTSHHYPIMSELSSRLNQPVNLEIRKFMRWSNMNFFRTFFGFNQFATARIATQAFKN